MKNKFKLRKKKNFITVKMSIVIITMLLLIIGIGYSKLSTMLTINGTVTGTYTPVEGYDFIVEETGGEDTPTLTYTTDKIQPSAPVTLEELMALNFDGINISDKYIDQIEVTATYSTKTGSNQSIVCMLTVDNTDYHQTLSFGKQETNITKTLTFSGLHISPNATFKIAYEDATTTNKKITISNQVVTVHLVE